MRECVVEEGGGESHPVWVRGLKHFLCTIGQCSIGSHPVWVRGLKRHK